MESISVIAVFAVLIGSFALMACLTRGHGPVPAPVGVGTILFLFAGMSGIGFYSHWRTKRRVRQYGLFCPSCHGVLTGATGAIAIASDNCALCGGKLFIENDPTSPPSLSSPSPNSESRSPALECPRTKEELRLRERAMGSTFRPLLVLLVLLVGVSIAAPIMLLHAKALPKEGHSPAMLLPIALVVLWAAFFMVASRQKHRTREYGMACPACQKLLEGLAQQLATMTGFCCGCGERLLEDVQCETETNAVQRKEFAERKRTAAREFRSSTFLFFPIGALGVGAIIVACIFVPSRGDYHGLPFSTLQNGMIFGPLVLMYGAVFLVCWQVKRRRQKYGLLCASCRKPLEDGDKRRMPAGKLAVAIGQCVHCGGNPFAAGMNGEG